MDLSNFVARTKHIDTYMVEEEGLLDLDVSSTGYPSQAVVIHQETGQLFLVKMRIGVGPQFQENYSRVYISGVLIDLARLNHKLTGSGTIVYLRGIWLDNSRGDSMLLVNVHYNDSKNCAVTEDQVESSLSNNYAGQSVSVLVQIDRQNLWRDKYEPYDDEHYEFAKKKLAWI